MINIEGIVLSGVYINYMPTIKIKNIYYFKKEILRNFSMLKENYSRQSLESTHRNEKHL